ncbi:MAG: hypothetical protein C5B53_02150 [Candidatus Melainabacteria bacterium]|nr:MAG: hypothetical protein C5B53_02150 [Candidatus Melainabacteria bacterium]
MSKAEPLADDELQPKPQLELEPVYGGPNGPRQTAIGAGAQGDGPEPRRFSSGQAPNWFNMVFPVARAFTKLQLKPLTPKRRRLWCENARLSDDELTVLTMRWHMNLNLEWTVSGDNIKDLAEIESLLERQAAWKLGLYGLYCAGFPIELIQLFV